MKTKIKLVQQIPKSKNLYGGVIDGFYGLNKGAGLSSFQNKYIILSFFDYPESGIQPGHAGSYNKSAYLSGIVLS